MRHSKIKFFHLAMIPFVRVIWARPRPMIWWPDSFGGLVLEKMSTCIVRHVAHARGQGLTTRNMEGYCNRFPYQKKQWQTVAMDLIVALPPTLDGNTSLVVFVDKLTKIIHIAPCVGQSDAPALARLFLENVFRYYCMPTRFISDHDTRFNSDFLKGFLGIAK
jgi:hypothetical protein